MAGWWLLEDGQLVEHQDHRRCVGLGSPVRYPAQPGRLGQGLLLPVAGVQLDRRRVKRSILNLNLQTLRSSLLMSKNCVSYNPIAGVVLASTQRVLSLGARSTQL